MIKDSSNTDMIVMVYNYYDNYDNFDGRNSVYDAVMVYVMGMI